MIYLGHKEVWPPGHSSDPSLMDAQQKLNVLYKNVLDQQAHYGGHAIKTNMDSGKVNVKIIPWNQIFHCGD